MINLFGEDISDKLTLADKYLMAPTTVLNTRDPKWQDLKRKWISKGIKSEIGRVDSVKNMLPSCRSCNQYKSTYGLEVFREQLAKIPGRLERDVSTYGIAKRFGLIIEQPEPIEFYFEKIGITLN